MRNEGITLILIFLISLLPLEASFFALDSRVCLFFFFGAGCPECTKVEPQINQLEQKHPQLDVYSFEIYGNRTNLQLLNSLFDRYKVPQELRKIPAVFISNTYLNINILYEAVILSNILK